jgi:hypothetical protein
VSVGEYYDAKANSELLSVLPKSVQDDQCSPAPVLAVIYFFTYIFLANYLLVNMVVGIIIDNMQSITYQEDLPVTNVSSVTV